MREECLDGAHTGPPASGYENSSSCGYCCLGFLFFVMIIGSGAVGQLRKDHLIVILKFLVEPEFGSSALSLAFCLCIGMLAVGAGMLILTLGCCSRVLWGLCISGCTAVGVRRPVQNGAPRGHGRRFRRSFRRRRKKRLRLRQLLGFRDDGRSHQTGIGAGTALRLYMTGYHAFAARVVSRWRTSWAKSFRARLQRRPWDAIHGLCGLRAVGKSGGGAFPEALFLPFDFGDGSDANVIASSFTPMGCGQPETL